MSKPFYIAVNPVGSAFGRALQQALINKIKNRVYRVIPDSPRLRGKQFIDIMDHGYDKIQQLTAFTNNNISCPRWTTDPGQITTWNCKSIFARKLVNSTGGQGIIDFVLGDNVPTAPLYTEYIPKKTEYRFHIFNEQVIDIQEKRKRNGVDGNYKVRNLDNGYVYCRDAVNPPDGAADLAIRAVKALGYLYGAVDLIFNQKRNQCYVLEVNSRPGLEGSTPDKYAEAVINYFNLERV